MIIDFSGSFELLRQYRIAWLSGRFGAGKTAMAVAMAEYLADKYDYRVYANFPLVFSEFDTGIKGVKVLHAVIILDEAGLEMVAKINALSDKMIAYTRKMDVIFLLPSFIPPGPRLRFLQYYPIINLTGAGIPFAIYGWRVNMAGFKASGAFGVWRPERIYRLYNSFVAQQDTEVLYEQVVQRVEKFAGSKISQNNIDQMDKLLTISSELENVAQLLQEGVASSNPRKRK